MVPIPLLVAALTASSTVSRHQPRPPLLREFRPVQEAAVFHVSTAGVRFGSEAVVLDGLVLKAGRDYTVDWERGVLRLAVSAAPGSVLQVMYAAAELPRFGELPPPPSGTGHRPLQWMSVGGQVARGLGARVIGLNGEVDSLELQLRSGVRRSDFSEETSEGPGRSTVAYNRVDPLDPRTAASGREEFASSVEFKPNPTTRLALDNSFTREGPLSDDYVERERRRVSYQQGWGRTLATLLWDERRSLGGAVAEDRSALSIGLTHPYARGGTVTALLQRESSPFFGGESRAQLNVRQQLGSIFETQAGLTVENSDLDGALLEAGASLFARPSDRADLRFTYNAVDSDRYGIFHRFKAASEIQVGSATQLSGEWVYRTSDRGERLMRYDLGLASQVARGTRVETNFNQAIRASGDRDYSGGFRIEADPSSVVKLRLGLDLNRRLEDGLSLDRGQGANWSLALGGKRYARIDGYHGRFASYGESNFQDSLYRLEVKPHTLFALNGSLRQVDGIDTQRSLLGAGASVNPVRGVELLAAYRQPQLPSGGLLPEGGKEVQLKLSPLAGVKVFGGYNLRPEDRQGLLLDERHRTVGLETRLGSLALSGSRTRLDRIPTQGREQRTDVTATLAVGRGTQLFGGLRLREAILGERLFGQSYRFGINQGLRSSFFLMLEGQVGWLTDGAGLRAVDPDDTRAQARLGIRF